MSLLGKEGIPAQLWQNETLNLPPCLCGSYQKMLQYHNLYQEALDTTPDERIYGGRSSEETLRHFAKRYGVSVARLESLVVDPHEAFGSISCDMGVSLAEGHVSILDIACGSGAVGASLLSTISVLRANKKLPKLPLQVSIVAGDCSQTALEMYQQMMKDLTPALKNVGIDVSFVSKQWEAEESSSTSELFDLLFEVDPNSEEYLVVIANFAGYLSAHFNQFDDSVKHIFDRTSNKKCTIMWVEYIVKQRVPWRSSAEKSPFSHRYAWYHPFQMRSLPCAVLVKEYRRD